VRKVSARIAIPGLLVNGRFYDEAPNPERIWFEQEPGEFKIHAVTPAGKYDEVKITNM
jgi:hypothetical protein